MGARPVLALHDFFQVMLLGRCLPSARSARDLGLVPSLGEGNGGGPAESLPPSRAQKHNKRLGPALTDPDARRRRPGSITTAGPPIDRGSRFGGFLRPEVS
jgi:hypothetical protein